MIKIYTPEQIAKIREGGKILAQVFKVLKTETKEGVSLKYLDSLAFDTVKKLGAEPGFLNYQPDGAEHPYPASICASLNEVIVHGQPTNYKLKSGDVLKIDFGVKYKGFYTDSAFTVIINSRRASASLKESQNLVKATYKALGEAIKQARSGNHLGDIGWAVEQTAKKYKLNVIKGLTGHGVGETLHEEPYVYNYGDRGQGLELRAGMVLAIEPMLSTGSDQIIQLRDESWATIDGSLSAQFEHTIAITEKGAMTLTS